jgi:hypothetical protein
VERAARAPFVTALIHADNFYRSGTPWHTFFFAANDKPLTPPYNLNAPDDSRVQQSGNRNDLQNVRGVGGVRGKASVRRHQRGYCRAGKGYAMKYWLGLLVLGIFVTAGCGRLGSAFAPTPRPTYIFTPITAAVNAYATLGAITCPETKCAKSLWQVGTFGILHFLL